MSEDLKNILERLEKLEKENQELKEKLISKKQSNPVYGIPILEKEVFHGLMLAVSGSYDKSPNPEDKLSDSEIAELKRAED